eukprot:scaffold314228_cov39-Prasinocladus_malaysianus.AAC.1
MIVWPAFADTAQIQRRGQPSQPNSRTGYVINSLLLREAAIWQAGQVVDLKAHFLSVCAGHCVSLVAPLDKIGHKLALVILRLDAKRPGQHLHARLEPRHQRSLNARAWLAVRQRIFVHGESPGWRAEH